MFRKYLFYLLLCLALPLFAQEETPGIRFFHGSFQEALQESQRQNKPLFVDFYATWCGPCKRMAREVFTQAEVGKLFNEKLIAIKLDAELPENVDIAKKYNVDAFPTLAFLQGDGKIISIHKGAMNAKELLNNAKEALGEVESFESMYERHRKNPEDLELQQALLVRTPQFLSAQEGITAERWVVRLRKLFRSYWTQKKGPALINATDYRLLSNLAEEEDKEEIANFINANLKDWVKVLGEAPAYYIIEYNDAKLEQEAKAGKDTYLTHLERIRTDYKDAYAIVPKSGLSPYDRAKAYYGALFLLYKDKNADNYIQAIDRLYGSLPETEVASDYGKAAQDLYYAVGSKLKTQHHQKAIDWVSKALKGQTSLMDRINFLVMIGDSYRELKDYAKSETLYKQAYLESTQMKDMQTAQSMLQAAILEKLAKLELLK